MNTARLSNLMARPRFIATRVTRLHAALLRLSGGRLKRSRLLAGGQPVLALSTTGRKSGEVRSTVLAYVPDGENFAVVPSNAGQDRTPSWWLNLQADPRAEVEVAGQSHAVRARPATPEEQPRLWRAFVDQYGGFEDYTQMTDRDIPVVILEPAAV
jgi:F420H(2)-dependent quinone reductase